MGRYLLFITKGFNCNLSLTLYSRLGFTAIVNKELSVKYETLVNRAPELIKTLPWGPDFEIDVFRKPDFTALEVLSFSTGGIPFIYRIHVNILKFWPQTFQAGLTFLITMTFESPPDSRMSLLRISWPPRPQARN